MKVQTEREIVIGVSDDREGRAAPLLIIDAGGRIIGGTLDCAVVH